MIQACNGKDILSALKAKQAVLNLICYYMECCPPESIVLASEDFDSPLSDAMLYVQNHLSEQISVPQMAQAAGYHVSYFTQLFQKRMGISPGQFIQQKKAETAAQLLTSTDLPISEIAESLDIESIGGLVHTPAHCHCYYIVISGLVSDTHHHSRHRV